MLMRRSRRSHRRQHRTVRAHARIAAAVALAAVFTLVLAAFALSGTDVTAGRAGSPRATEPPLASQPAVAPTSEETDTARAVEVPQVVGKTLAEAQVLLSAIGVCVETEEDVAVPADAVGDARVVLGQNPPAGTVLGAGATVRLTVPAAPDTLGRDASAEAVVVIDPGHQSRGDSTPEPVGPGADERKPRVTGGTTGVVTRVPEYEVVLQISTNLKTRLERAGITVVMTRTTNDVNISNSERAAIANEAGADLFVRIHADGNVDSTQAGISTLYPGENRWTGLIAAPSHRAALFVHEAVVVSTGAASRGVVARTDLSGFNWSRVPTLLVECGFLSNPVEDRLLSSPHYQDKLAEGMASGIIAFLNE
ncbi:MAG: N-acetylmuramoyl-L-alanine amidase [Coriobacteriia bacterium]|nr:N-acetylmuramoyl-L-alanine amidase [Coriobacteriia bacterium]